MIRTAFLRLANYAVLPIGSLAIEQGISTSSPADDILGNIRSTPEDIGAFEKSTTGNVTVSGVVLTPLFFLLL